MNLWDDRYNIAEYYYGTEPNDFLRANVQLIRPEGKILCLAEGEGRNAVYLAGVGFHVTAVDGSKTGLEKLARLAKERRVKIHTVVSNLDDYQIHEKSWDAIISIWCHIPPSLRIRIHREVAQGLKPGGIYIFESYHPRQLAYKTGGPSTADLLSTAADVKAELQGLHFKLLQEIDREIHEGKGHNGLSAVVQAIARKEQ